MRGNRRLKRPGGNTTQNHHEPNHNNRMNYMENIAPFDSPDAFIYTVKSLDCEFISVPASGPGFYYDASLMELPFEPWAPVRKIITLRRCTRSQAFPVLREKEYAVAITGEYPMLGFDNCEDIIRVDQWGATKWKSLARAFRNCQSIRSVPKKAPDLSMCESIQGMFENALYIKGDFSNWDVSNIVDMGSAFSYCMRLSGDFSKWDTGKATNMRYMFYETISARLKLDGWDVSNVSDMSNMFGQSDHVPGDLSGWDTRNVENMDYMFQGTDHEKDYTKIWALPKVKGATT